MRIATMLLALGLIAGTAAAAPVVTLGPPDSDGARTLDPGSIQVEMLGAGDAVNIQLSFTFDPFCIQPFDVSVVAVGDGGTFSEQTGVVVNQCGGDTSVFDITLTGDGTSRLYVIEFHSQFGTVLGSIPVSVFAGSAPELTLGPPAGNGFATVDPGSIRIDSFGAGDTVLLQLALTIDPFCIRPFDVAVTAPGSGGTFADQTGVVVNECGGDTSVFTIELSGDGAQHVYDIEFVDAEFGGVLASITVVLSPTRAPVVTLGPPQNMAFAVDPGSIRVEYLNAGNFVDMQVTMTVNPLCIVPILIDLAAPGNGGTFTNFTGTDLNGCGGESSVFDIRFTGDGQTHAFDLVFVDANAGSPLGSIPVELYPGSGDFDRDGVSNLDDNCLNVSNPSQYDSNGDRIGNLCDADISGPLGREDCLVNFIDLQAVKAAFFSTPATPNWNPHADFDNSRRINFRDLQILKQQIFGPPGPSANGCN